MKKRILSLFLAIAMVATVAPVAAGTEAEAAADEYADDIKAGTLFIGDNNDTPFVSGAASFVVDDVTSNAATIINGTNQQVIVRAKGSGNGTKYIGSTGSGDVAVGDTLSVYFSDAAMGTKLSLLQGDGSVDPDANVEDDLYVAFMSALTADTGNASKWRVVAFGPAGDTTYEITGDDVGYEFIAILYVPENYGGIDLRKTASRNTIKNALDDLAVSAYASGINALGVYNTNDDATDPDDFVVRAFAGEASNAVAASSKKLNKDLWKLDDASYNDGVKPLFLNDGKLVVIGTDPVKSNRRPIESLEMTFTAADGVKKDDLFDGTDRGEHVGQRTDVKDPLRWSLGEDLYAGDDEYDGENMTAVAAGTTLVTPGIIRPVTLHIHSNAAGDLYRAGNSDTNYNVVVVNGNIYNNIFFDANVGEGESIQSVDRRTGAFGTVNWITNFNGSRSSYGYAQIPADGKITFPKVSKLNKDGKLMYLQGWSANKGSNVVFARPDLDKTVYVQQTFYAVWSETPIDLYNNAVFRLFNPTTGEHLYTQDRNEYIQLGTQGWRQENVAFYGLTYDEQGRTTNYDFVRRMFNPATGEHHYVSESSPEVANLVGQGWRLEGTVFIAPKAGDPIYRVYNPNVPAVAQHLFTKDANEMNTLITTQGYIYEGAPFHSVAQ